MLYGKLCCRFEVLPLQDKKIGEKIDGWNPAIAAFIAGFSVTLEPENRRSEIALFIMPRFFETLWNWLKRRRLVFPIPGGELLVFAFAMEIINYFYQMEINQILREENAIKPTYLALFKRFWVSIDRLQFTLKKICKLQLGILISMHNY